MKILGIDYGTKRIGLALGETEVKIASPFGVVSAITDVVEVVKKEEIDLIVLGHPVTMKSESGTMSKEVLLFKTELNRLTRIEIVLIDERLSSKSADSLLGKRDNVNRDAVAAMVILQTYFDNL